MSKENDPVSTRFLPIEAHFSIPRGPFNFVILGENRKNFKYIDYDTFYVKELKFLT